MAITKQKITPCLWFNTEAEEAAKFYCSVFKDSKLGKISRYTEAGREVHHKPAGSVMVVEFEIRDKPSLRSTAVRTSSSMKPSRCRCAARRRPRWITSGAN